MISIPPLGESQCHCASSQLFNSWIFFPLQIEARTVTTSDGRTKEMTTVLRSRRSLGTADKAALYLALTTGRVRLFLRI